jgi:hypothetical protein
MYDDLIFSLTGSSSSGYYIECISENLETIITDLMSKFEDDESAELAINNFKDSFLAEYYTNKSLEQVNSVIDGLAGQLSGLATIVPIYFTVTIIEKDGELRAWNEGDAVIPFGKSNPVKIKKLRIDRKIASIPVLPVLRLENNTIIWAPNIRHSNFAVVKKEAYTQYVKITMLRK